MAGCRVRTLPLQRVACRWGSPGLPWKLVRKADSQSPAQAAEAPSTVSNSFNFGEAVLYHVFKAANSTTILENLGRQ